MHLQHNVIVNQENNVIVNQENNFIVNQENKEKINSIYIPFPFIFISALKNISYQS